MSIVQLLAQKNFITYSKVIAKNYGVNAAILLGALCGYQTCHNDGEFYKTQNEISDDTCLGIYEIKDGLKILKSAGILLVTRKGMPAQNYYFVAANKLAEILLTSEVKITQQDVENFDNCTTNNTNIIYTNKKEKKKNNNKWGVGENKLSVNDVILAQNEELQEPLRDFVEMRKAIKKPITTRGLTLAIKTLYELSQSTSEQIEIINQSVVHSWQSFYAIKDNRAHSRNRQEPNSWEMSASDLTTGITLQ